MAIGEKPPCWVSCLKKALREGWSDVLRAAVDVGKCPSPRQSQEALKGLCHCKTQSTPFGHTC